MCQTKKSTYKSLYRCVPTSLRNICLMLLVGVNLSACVPLVIGGAVGAGALVATDRRSTGMQVEDEGLELRGRSRIRTALQDRGNISVTSYNRIMLLTGQVPNDADKQLAQETAKALPNVRTVVNELTVGTVTSSSQQFKDGLTSSKVKTVLLGAKYVKSNIIKVVTENKVVYLMGIVTDEEGNRAADVASTVDGVRKVIKVFEIVDEATLKNSGVSSQTVKATNDVQNTGAETTP